MENNIFNILSYILSGTALAMLIAAWILCMCVASVYGIVNFKKFTSKKKKAIAFPIMLAAFPVLDVAMYMVLLVENIALGCLIVYLVHELKTAKYLVARANEEKNNPVIAATKDEIYSELDVLSLNKKDEISVEDARSAISDSLAAQFVDKKKSEVCRFRKKSIVNIDTLSENFQNGDTINIESLVAKHIVPKGTDYVKVLARGRLDKQLFVEANDYSSDAIKMILLTDGKVTKII